jgi:8-oxo-dGTP pyrophosphatase MutT (NUDIX family)
MLFKEKPNFKCLWNGMLPLNGVKWGKLTSQEYNLPEKHTKLIKKYWYDHLKKFPEDYDGKLLFLQNFYFKNEILYLDIGKIRFSTVIFMASRGMRVQSGIGMLGVQCIIFSPDKNFILVGKRPRNVTYYPEIMTLPGGMLEIKDLSLKPNNALMREIYEEVKLPLKEECKLISILNGWNGISVTFLLQTDLSKNYKFDPDEFIVAEKDEWLNNLYWISTKELRECKNNQLLDGLIYLKYKLKNEKSK